MNILQVHSFESLAAADGPGLRFAVFLAGCPLRCAYCHNPDTWRTESGTAYTAEEICAKAARYKPYYAQNGGVTVSGGEPLLQARAVSGLTAALQAKNIHVAIDTAGSLYNDEVEKLLQLKPMLLLDIKSPDEARYRDICGGELQTTLRVLQTAQRCGCEVWLRYVIVPQLTDSERDLRQVIALGNQYSCVSNITLLPYHTLGVYKYEALGIPYRLTGAVPPAPQDMQRLNNIVQQEFHAACNK